MATSTLKSGPGNTSMSTVATLEGKPESIKLKSLSLELADVQPPANIFTGAYGSTSLQLLLEATSRRNRINTNKGISSRLMLVDLNYTVDNFDKTRSPSGEDIIAQTGWMHFDRLVAAYRDYWRDRWLTWIAADHSTTHARNLRAQDLSLADLTLKHPNYVYKTMRTNRDVRAIVHPARLALDPKTVIWVASVKYDAERLNTARVRFVKDISVII